MVAAKRAAALSHFISFTRDPENRAENHAMEDSDLVTPEQVDSKFKEFIETFKRYSMQELRSSEYEWLRDLSTSCYAYGDMVRNLSFRLERLRSLAQDHGRKLFICKDMGKLTPFELKSGAITEVFRESSEVGQRYARKCVNTRGARIMIFDPDTDEIKDITHCYRD